MTCEDASLLLSARMDGELTAEELEKLEDHLAGCPECRALSEELEQISSAMSEELEVSAPEGFARGVMERLEENGQKKSGRVIPLFRRPAVRSAAAAAACALLCIGLYRGAVLHRGAPAAPENTFRMTDSEQSTECTAPGEAQEPAAPAPGGPACYSTAPAAMPDGPVSGLPAGSNSADSALEADHATAYLSRDYGSIAVTIPEGWEYESFSGEAEDHFGIRFRPEGRDGAVCLSCCAQEQEKDSGLIWEELVLPGGQQVPAGHRGEDGPLRVLLLDGAPGRYTAEIEESASDWWEEQGPRALEIISTAQLGG